ncbi:MAG: hypothetical protein IT240_07795 [Bacteroidia bacterium]|nr:hypothetical protein [Bacteroidia bacterium]
MKKTLIIALLFAAAACSKKAVPDASKAESALTQDHVERAKQKFPDLTLAQLQEGKKINDETCGSCHKLHQPTELSEEAWRKIVPPMAKKGKLDSRSEDLVLRYLVSLSKN